jgi:hypothetical protein
MVIALAALLGGAALLGIALSGAFTPGARTVAAAPPQAPQVVVVTPAPSPTASAQVTTAATKTAKKAKSNDAALSPTEQQATEQRFTANAMKHVPASWVSGFYSIYAQAQRTYGVNWLLIASVHKQETAFSTHPTTYHGLNFANCCAGPMQFNVTNGVKGGTGSTWARYKNAGAAAARPASYPHETLKHPSVYDDYDAIMAAAALLRDSGAGPNLDASAWRAAYDYYGHDATGVDYADEVVARAIGWGQKAFCINCGTDSSLMSAVDAAWGAPVRTELDAAAAAAAKAEQAAHKHHAATAVAARTRQG